MKYGIDGCEKDMTSEEHKDFMWARDPLNPVNKKAEETPEETEEKRQRWLGKRVRKKRNSMLSEADTYKHEDHPKRIEKGATAVNTYIQALRDMTDTFASVPSDDDKNLIFPEL